MQSLLSRPFFYTAFGRLIGSDKLRTRFVREHLRPVTGEKVLDIGCGPADLLGYLPAVDYLGFDASADYIDAARRRFGSRGRFFAGIVNAARVEERDFDLVIASGILHHLDDAEAIELFRLAETVLRSAGRIVTLDGCYVPGQSQLSRYLLGKDRGKYVRDQPGYEYLAGQVFHQRRTQIRTDLLNIPYTHIILECTR